MFVTKLLSPGANLTDAYAVRAAVFVNEQGFSEAIEFDDIDHIAYHIVIFDGQKPIATGRVFPEQPESKDTYVIGRVAVLKKYRGKEIGIKLMTKLEECAKALGGSRVVLGAQLRAREFYTKRGYKEYGEEYMDEQYPHINMEKAL